MSELSVCEKKAKEITEKLIPYMSWQSSDVKGEYDAGEYIAAFDGAIHDLGALRFDLPDETLTEIEDLIDMIRDENDAYSIRFLDRMIIGFNQLKTRHELLKTG
jgi:hypothetical protein